MKPEIEIHELSENELEDMPDDMKSFGPLKCINCENKKDLKRRWFSVNATSDNQLIEKEIENIMKEKYGIQIYSHFLDLEGKRELLTASKCPKCDSEDIIWA